MEPLLQDGDIVFFKLFNDKESLIKVGQIVIFNHPHKNIRLIKRVKSINKYGIAVSGDNKFNSQDSNFFGFINKKSIIGIMTSSVRLKINIKLKKSLIHN